MSRAGKRFRYPRQECSWCSRQVDARRFKNGSPKCERCERAIALADEHGVKIRRGEGAYRCCDCDEVGRFSPKPERSSFSPTTSRRGAYGVRCKPCETRRVVAYAQTHPEGKRLRDARYRERLYNDPVAYQRVREVGRASHRRHYERIRNDPERWAAMLANNRIYYHLKAEREGREITRVVRLGVVDGWKKSFGNNGEGLPEAPLRAWLEAVIAKRDEDVDLGTLAAELGVAERQLNSIQRAEYPCRQLGVADRMLTLYDRPIEVPGYGVVWRIEDLWPVELGEEMAA